MRYLCQLSVIVNSIEWNLLASAWSRLLWHLDLHHRRTQRPWSAFWPFSGHCALHRRWWNLLIQHGVDSRSVSLQNEFHRWPYQVRDASRDNWIRNGIIGQNSAKEVQKKNCWKEEGKLHFEGRKGMKVYSKSEEPKLWLATVPVQCFLVSVG